MRYATIVKSRGKRQLVGVIDGEKAVDSIFDKVAAQSDDLSEV